MQESQDPGQGRMRFAAAGLGVAGLLLAGGCVSDEAMTGQHVGVAAAEAADNAAEAVQQQEYAAEIDDIAARVTEEYGFDSSVDTSDTAGIRASVSMFAHEAALDGDVVAATGWYQDLLKMTGPDNPLSDSDSEEAMAFFSDEEGFVAGFIVIDKLRDDANSKDWDNAIAVVDGIEDENTRGFFKEKLDQEYTRAAVAAAREGDFHNAEALAANVDDEGVFDKAGVDEDLDQEYTRAAVAAAREGDFHNAEALAANVDDEGVFDKAGVDEDLARIKNG